MQRERVADDIYVFTSAVYVQVTASVVLTSQGAVLIDTLIYPDETLAMKRFIEGRLGAHVSYVINTHFHADHTTGTCFFPDAQVIAHDLCRQLLHTRGRDALEKAKQTSEELQSVELVLPQLVFESGFLTLHLGDKTLQLWQSPGHSPDSIVCMVKEDRTLFAADTLMSLPYFVDGSYDDLLQSLENLRGGSYEHVVQGHGEIILRGEVEERLEEDIHYLTTLRVAVDRALAAPEPEHALTAISLEKCGKNSILLNGSAQQLHRQNVIKLAAQRREVVSQL